MESADIMDTGDIAAVPRNLQCDNDPDPESLGATALHGGDDTEGLSEVYDNPGDHVPDVNIGGDEK